MALTDNLIDNGRKSGELVCHTAGAEIFLGALLCHDGAGAVVPAATGLVFAGIADGYAKEGEPVKVWKTGVFERPSTAAIAVSNIGTPVAFDSDDKVKATTGGTDACGILEDVKDTTNAIRIDGYAK
ncbi:hypothetical protein Emin_0953 [Elusimicrobium minutum Pei191]|uniref:DUF2190 family protein n=1 Tax=Elusimicrobium minutum (strain Pei191) TaxID=445932 RepID=B2KDB0_ELUMP|nr:DUF2190 family protein [Elusimicrobium minutum]ACC98506.1 hypothetical protein Emin_0953 [Elusimicrobium minutum Pei191]